MPSPFLTKSDFKACYECGTKLFYRKNGYDDRRRENEYLRFLADGGFMIEFLAKARFPNGHDLSSETHQQTAWEKTRALLASASDLVLFEAAALSDRFLIRMDILQRKDGVLNLIEVKSCSSEHASSGGSQFRNSRGEIYSKRKPYLLDCAFQTMVLRRAFEGVEVVPWLCMVNKAARARDTETFDRFKLSRDPAKPHTRPEVHYDGDLLDLKNSDLVTIHNVASEVDELMPDVERRAQELAALFTQDGSVVRSAEKISQLYSECRACEFRFPLNSPPARHGFGECWGDMANEVPHILDLHRVSQIGSSSFPDPIPAFLESGKASILDLGENQLGASGERRERRLLQWRQSKSGMEHLPETLVDALRSHDREPGRPLYFVDFEACTVALPHHPGMHPYERVAFQWSCHWIDDAGNLHHADWLNTDREFPNFAFALSLQRQLGERGTVYVWSAFERSTLLAILSQLGQALMEDESFALRVARVSDRKELESLEAWIERLLGPPNDKGKRDQSPRIRDLHDFARRVYFHPEMGGRSSIKVVLPAVWRNNAALRQHPWFADYAASGGDMDPYKALPSLPLADGECEDLEGAEEEVVTEGTGAIRVYQEMIFTNESEPRNKANREVLLRQYCKLDTAAMVMIWYHWRGEQRL